MTDESSNHVCEAENCNRTAVREEADATRNQVAEKIAALPTYVLSTGWGGGSMEKEKGMWGDYLNADDVYEALGIEPTYPNGWRVKA